MKRSAPFHTFLTLSSSGVPSSSADPFVVISVPKTLLSQSLRSEIDRLVQVRVQARWVGDFETADQIREQIQKEVGHAGLEVVLEDIPRRLGGGSEWRLQLKNLLRPNIGTDNSHTPPLIHSDDNNFRPALRGLSQKSVLNLAHAVLGRVVSASDRRSGLLSASDQALKEAIVEQAKNQLQGWCNIHMKLGSTFSLNMFPYSDVESDSMLLRTIESTLVGFPTSAAVDERERNSIRHWISVETHLRGRKAADAAFWFALAAVDDEQLYELLTAVVLKELTRFANRPSCRIKDVMAMADRLAAAGIRNNHELETLIMDIVRSKDESDKEHINNMTFRDPNMKMVDFHSDNCALMIWKFSTRQRKQKSFLEYAADHWTKTKAHDWEADMEDSSLETSSADHLDQDEAFVLSQPLENVHQSVEQYTYDWNAIFADPSRPLVVDLGCGMGVSLLGLAAEKTTDDDETSLGGNVPLENWARCNFLGVDLSALAIGYANNIAKRWNIKDRVFFTVHDATKLLQTVRESYPGQVATVMVQFPTPYRLGLPGTNNEVVAGNGQLPSSSTDGFMVTIDLLQEVAKVLRNPSGNGRLVVQSNCEDVAIFMRETACEQLRLFTAVEAVRHQTEESMECPTQRSNLWRAMGGAKAIGPGWWAEPILPRRGRTETEVACMINRTPVHRCILELRS